MPQEEKIFKNKFAYFFAIIFILGWLLFFGYNIFKIYIKGYGLQEKYLAFKFPIFILYFLIFPLLIITFVNIFKESKKIFIYLNLTVFLIIIFHSIFFYVGVQKSKNIFQYFISFIFINMLDVIGPTILINYFKQNNINNEIDEIGKSENHL